MTPDARETSGTDYTLDALDDPTGKRIVFEDFVEKGDTVSLYRDPSQERGFFGLRVVYRDGHGDWHLRELTAAENAARTDRILGDV